MRQWQVTVTHLWLLLDRSVLSHIYIDSVCKMSLFLILKSTWQATHETLYDHFSSVSPENLVPCGRKLMTGPIT